MAGAQPLTLDLLTVAEASDLLSRRLGQERVASEPRAADDIIGSCVRLPLALAIVAARAATHPDFPLAALAAELREAGSSLNQFASPDPATDARAVFSWSYRQLEPEAARLFRLLGLHPGPDISPLAAASLVGVPPQRARPILAELALAHLVTKHTPGRYGFHDLLRAYAGELVHVHDTPVDRQAAVHRILDCYLHTSHAAARLLNPQRDPPALALPQDGVTPDDLTDHAQAMAWFATEHPVLLAALDQAVRAGLDTHAWQLAWSLADFFERLGRWHDWAATQRVALEAARRLDDRFAQARVHRIAAHAYLRLGGYDDAHAHLGHALDLCTDLGDRTNQAHTHLSLSWVFAREGNDAEALRHTQYALDLFRAVGHRAGEANTLTALGWHYDQLGNHQQALTYCRQALELHQQLHDRDGEAHTWDILGYANDHLGDHPHAIACYQHALDLYRDLGDRYNEAGTLTTPATTQHATGDHPAARTTWQQALNILDELHGHDAEQLRSRLRDIENA
ncbi:tetratricopeptide repeat protein [Flindersiella endophytica]